MALLSSQGCAKALASFHAHLTLTETGSWPGCPGQAIWGLSLPLRCISFIFSCAMLSPGMWGKSARVPSPRGACPCRSSVRSLPNSLWGIFLLPPPGLWEAGKCPATPQPLLGIQKESFPDPGSEGGMEYGGESAFTPTSVFSSDFNPHRITRCCCLKSEALPTLN